MNQFFLSELNIYPIKSLAGISLTTSILEEKGLQYDRRWMLIDQEGTFISQRKYPELALLQITLGEEQLTITHKNNPAQTISFGYGENTGQLIAVNVWGTDCQGIEVNTTVSKWFSALLQTEARLVQMPEAERRLVDPRYAPNNEVVSFADGYPCLIISQASLDGLNEKLDQAVPMDRFRPNFVFTGGEPHIEDRFDTFYIGDLLFRAVKPCSRCVMITVDQQTATKSAEPLKTLARYRTVDKKIMFGQNLIHQGSGTIRIGDELVIREWKV
ncbi:oxidoreductase [Pedobacter lusitanus]|uniref:Oxidoreductase n=1 Tax=Pedobacter lusitanus TaxID=1503925 RepID=A0A0D0GPD9_9SPHI|nr:MOSC N-terminal beta barrel domain-containing protein [Pedobacter lusitanus]KIO78055.1 oxidoreductase [Pedobacter lusitanus]